MEKRPFDQLGLSAETLKAVAKMGFEEASPIQTAVIPVALTERDKLVIGVGYADLRKGFDLFLQLWRLLRTDKQDGRICFAIPYGELNRWEDHLGRNAIPIESKLRWPHGGTSLYFRDPDNNSVEVATPGLWPNR